jgi:PA14 domain
MSETRFVFETVDFQNGANTINNFVNAYNANCNAATTGNSFQFKSDYDRMKNVLGSKGQTRNSGFYEGLYATYYPITVTQPTLPSSNGPGNSGWGKQLASGPLTQIYLNNSNIFARAGQDLYTGVQIAGYLYSPSNTTTTFQTTTDDGIVVYFNGSKVIDSWTYHGATTDTSASLTVNKGYNPIRILFFNGSLTAQCDFQYKLPTSAAYSGNLKCNFFYNYNQM